jgi:hypothetical protein
MLKVVPLPVQKLAGLAEAEAADGKVVEEESCTVTEVLLICAALWVTLTSTRPDTIASSRLKKRRV